MSEPDVRAGIEYWSSQPASLDGVLGGYGSGSLPRIDSLGSRLFLLNLYPQLSTIPSSLCPLNALPDVPRTRALDVGAGIGRVTSDVLLHLISDVTILEPVDTFVQEALSRARASASGALSLSQGAWRGLADQTKSVTILQGTLQDFHPLRPHHARFLDRVGAQPLRTMDEIGMGFDVIWCQWCLGHLKDIDLVAFLKRCHESLNKHRSKSLIMIKENICSDHEDGSPNMVFDDEDSSLTRSDKAWKVIFTQAGLRLVQEKVQDGLPEDIFEVKMCVIIFSQLFCVFK